MQAAKVQRKRSAMEGRKRFIFWRGEFSKEEEGNPSSHGLIRGKREKRVCDGIYLLRQVGTEYVS